MASLQLTKIDLDTPNVNCYAYALLLAGTLMLCQSSNDRNVWVLAGLVVGYSERLGGGDVPRRPDRAPVHGQQLWGLAHHGEGVHEGSDEDQGGRLSGRAAPSPVC